jgi:hypothetical protein
MAVPRAAPSRTASPTAPPADVRRSASWTGGAAGDRVAQPYLTGDWRADLALGAAGAYLGYRALRGAYRYFAGPPWVNGVRTLPLGQAVPVALQALVNCVTAAAAEAALALPMQGRTAVQIDQSSNYGHLAGPRRLSNWVSAGARHGGPLGGFHIPNATPAGVAAGAFFRAVFDAVRAGTRAQYGRADLFHGHVNYWNGDVVIVFHAKEYPSNLIDTQFASANALLDEPGTQFQTTHADFRYRNALYSFNRNAIDVIDLQTINAASPYHALLTANITLDQTQVGQFIAGINYLPREGVGIILA